MTDCKNPIGLIQGYIDNELDAATAENVLAHLNECPSCKAAYEADLAIAKAVRTHASYDRIPAALSRDILKTIRAESAPRLEPRFDWKHWWVPLVPVAACSLCLVMVLDLSSRQTDEVVAEHVRSLMEQHLTDVISSDRHTVKPWFTGKLDFSPPVFDFADQGYPLLGGRLDYLEHRNVAALAYRRNKHIINVFIMPETGMDVVSSVSAVRGFNVVVWHKNGLKFSAVSDLNTKELEELKNLILFQI